jgi:hypothetical protein
MRCPDKIDLSDETSKNAKTYQCELEAGHEGPHEMRMRVQWDAIAEECFHQQEQPAEDDGPEGDGGVALARAMLLKALQGDPELWIAYQANIAMTIHDMLPGGLEHGLRNKIADRLINVLFGVNVRWDANTVNDFLHAKHTCGNCGRETRVSTAGCDHCDLEDK